ncbi:MAG: GNAT family N-acetyltransferase [Gemmatimonadota bacterium]|nr:MAG: GNAT family N-acetyltransferase [Gemmatimonadota bacterium]
MGALRLTKAIETGPFLLPEVPPELTYLSFSSVQGRVTSISHPMINVVGAATLSANNADTTIRRVRNLFAQNNTSFSWRVGPNSTPKDLDQRLIVAGLVPQQILAGMALTNLNVSVPASPPVDIREPEPQDIEAVKNIIEHGYPTPTQWARILSRSVLQERKPGEADVRVYLAFVKESESPVAIGTSFFFPDEPVVMLGGAATLEEFRGRGIYTRLVAHRLEKARKEGAEAAVIQAVRTTSAAILEKIGFIEVCSLEVYHWYPDHDGKKA